MNKLRIAIVGPTNGIGGVTTHTYEIVKAFRKFSLKITVVSTSLRNSRLLTCFYPLKGIVQIFKISRELLLKRLHYDIIHVQACSFWGFMPVILCWFLSRVLGKKIIVTYHGGLLEEFVKRHQILVPFFMKKSNALFVISERQHKILKHKKLTGVVVLQNGYSQNLFKPIERVEARKNIELPQDKKIIVSVGNLETIKGHKYLIYAMKRVIQKEKDILCSIVGSGSQLKSLKSLVKDLGLDNNIRLLGDKLHGEIPFWINASDVFVLPSLAEGNPTVMFECLGCGKPFVGTNVGGIPEVIINGKLGILIEPKNSEQLAYAILKALDKEWDKDYILNYAKQFTWEEIAEKIMEVYKKVG